MEEQKKYYKERYERLKEEKKQKIQQNVQRRKKYYESEKGKAIYRNAWAKRRALVKGACVEITKEEKLLIKNFYARCPDGHCVDHIIPLKKGGKHVLSNLQYLTNKDNLKKSDKIFLEVLDKFLDGEILSISWLMNKFKLNQKEAREVFEEVTMRNEIGQYFKTSKISKPKEIKVENCKPKPKRKRMWFKSPSYWKDVTKP